MSRFSNIWHAFKRMMYCWIKVTTISVFIHFFVMGKSILLIGYHYLVISELIIGILLKFLFSCYAWLTNFIITSPKWVSNISISKGLLNPSNLFGFFRWSMGFWLSDLVGEPGGNIWKDYNVSISILWTKLNGVQNLPFAMVTDTVLLFQILRTDRWRVTIISSPMTQW